MPVQNSVSVDAARTACQAVPAGGRQNIADIARIIKDSVRSLAPSPI